MHEYTTQYQGIIQFLKKQGKEFESDAGGAILIGWSDKACLTSTI